MTNWIDLTNFAVVISGLTLAILGFILTHFMPYKGSWERKYFTVFFIFLIIYTCSDLASQISLIFFGPACAGFSQAAIFLESLFSSLLMPMLTIYLLHCTGETVARSRTFTFVIILWVVYFALLTVTQFTTYIYYVDEDNIYHRGSLYPLLLIPIVLSMLINITLLLKKRTLLATRQFRILAVNMFIPLVCMLIQICSYGLLLIVLGVSAAAFFMLISISIDQMEQFKAQQEEIMQQQASILALQMRPHFIYNTMTSIYYLVKQDTDKAQEVITNFTRYLRGNFSAFAKEDTIPFLEELEHIRSYLAVESVRFEDSLYVEYDTPFTSFSIPPLTLQPLVENSVKYGCDPESKPLHISIRTRKVKNTVKITIKDDGPGFSTHEKDSTDKRTHIALDNIRNRLKLICNGTLEIEAPESGGTVVIITIPFV